MKKFKLFIITGVLLATSSLVGFTLVNAQQQDQLTKMEPIICEHYTILCGASFTMGTVCGFNADEVKARIKAIKDAQPPCRHEGLVK